MLRNNPSIDDNLTNDLEGELEIPTLRRQLSVSYTNPETGQQTNEDPDEFTGAEKIARQTALVKENPNTGYARAIIEARQKAFIFSINVQDCRASFFNYNKKPDDDAPNSLSYNIVKCY